MWVWLSGGEGGGGEVAGKMGSRGEGEGVQLGRNERWEGKERIRKEVGRRRI